MQLQHRDNMTRIEYAINGDEFNLHCIGHAGFAEAGNDIVCAGISTLVQTLTTHLPEIAEEYEVHIDSGEVKCSAKGSKAIDCFQMILTGLRLLEGSYPQYLCIVKGVL